MTILRTTHSLVAVLTFVLLLSAFRGELRVALNAVDGPSLALVIPVLAFAALVTALTSAATALTLDMAALILLGLYMAEDGISALPMAGAIGLLIMAGLCIGLIRLSPDMDD
jgi:hypothetical protein